MEVAVALLDPPPGLVVGAGETVQARIGPDRRRAGARVVTLAARPEIDIEDHVDAELGAARPQRRDLFGHPSIVLREKVGRRVLPVEVSPPIRHG